MFWLQLLSSPDGLIINLFSIQNCIYIIVIEAPGNIPGALIYAGRRSENVQQSKIPDARDRKRDSRMACSSYVAHGADDGDRRERLFADIHANKVVNWSAHRPRAGAATVPLRTRCIV